MAFSLQGLNHYSVSYIVKKYWLNKIYPKEVRQANESGDLHLHNLDSLATYTFFGREVVIAKLNNQIKLISLKDLYEEIAQPEILLNQKDEAFGKYPQDLYLLDRNGWSKASRMVRKKKEREMRFIKSEQGRSVIVTDNHPFIVKNQKDGQEKEIEAKEVQEKNHLILSCFIPSLIEKEKLFFKKHLYLAEELLNKGHKNFFLEGFEYQDFIKNWGGSLRAEGTLSTANSANRLDNKLELTEELGYLVGIFIAEGNYHSWRLNISLTEEEIIKRVRRICAKLGIRSYLRDKESGKDISINCNTLRLIFEKVFQIKSGSKNKNLPPDILTYNLDFVKGIIAGIIDGDGTRGSKNKNGEITQTIIRVSSRTMLEQMAILLQFFEIIPRNGVSTKDIGKKNFFKGKEIIQNYPLYRLAFSKKENINFPSFKYQRARPARQHWRSEDYGWNKVLNNELTTIADDFIYDLTTESKTFLCNSLLVHNCCGWDLYDILLKGFGGVLNKVESKPAKHFRSALGQLVNFFYTLQGECFSADTQVLTDSGWRYFYEVEENDKIFTLNNQTDEIELQKPIKFYEFNYNGELYNFKSKKLDLLVTPNHNMVVNQYCPFCKDGRYRRKIVKAKDFKASEHFIPKNSIWKGKKEKWFILPAIEILQYRNFIKLNNQFPSYLNNSRLAFLSQNNTFSEILSSSLIKTFNPQPNLRTIS